MKKFTRGMAVTMAVAGAAVSLAACGGTSTTTETTAAKTEKILKAANSFTYTSLDVHKEYYGWYTSIDGISEALFKIGDDMSIEPLLAESATQDGNVWTVKLNPAASFSDGDKLTADMAVKNLKRVSAENKRFKAFAAFKYNVVDSTTFTIDTVDAYPTLKNELASPELGMIDLDHTTDFDNAPICTGPFVIDKFVPKGDVTVKKNTKYWNGDVKLDGAVFYYMQDDATKLTAMQNGEIDWYGSVGADALAIYKQDPNNYTLTQIVGERCQFYILNEKTLSDNVRAAVNSTVDKNAIAAYLEGTTSATDGPFAATSAYGAVSNPAKTDTEKAKKLLEADGYTLNSDGYYAKDRKELNISIKYYPARELDKLATLIQQQLKAIGVNSTLGSEEDPDSTYIAKADFDIGLYCMISDKYADPYYFISNTLADGSYYNVGGFKSDECEKLIKELKTETDTAKRAELAKQIIQIAINDNAYGYVGMFNKTTVAKPNVTGLASNNPFDFYGINANTDM